MNTGDGRHAELLKALREWPPSEADANKAADVIEELLEWIAAMRQASTLLQTPNGPMVMVPYAFMRDANDAEPGV